MQITKKKVKNIVEKQNTNDHFTEERMYIASKHIKILSTGEIPIKTMRCHFPPHKINNYSINPENAVKHRHFSWIAG